MEASETVDAKAAYALVDAGVISKMASSSNHTDERSSDDGIDHLVSKYSIPLYSSTPTKNKRGATDDDDTVELTTLEQWYEFYAVRYPSRGYLERQEQLLQLEQEKLRQNELLEREKRMQQGGWLRRFFFGGGGGGGGIDDQVTDDIRKQENQNNDKKYSGRDDFFDDNNQDDEQSVDNNHNDGMCGTTSSLDTNAITKEALAFHRFHLVSERRALCTKDHRGHTNRWHVVLPIRNCVGMDDDSVESEMRPTYCIVGYGKIAAFPPLPSSSSSPDPEQLNSGAKVTLTSDRDALCQFVRDKNHDSLSDLRHTRAALIGPDCLAVSWGRGDGFIVMYRRVQQQGGANKRGNKKEQILEVGWKAVAVVAPTDAVANEGLKSMTPSPYASGDNEQREIASLFESGPLRVTDLTPLVVKNDSNNGQDHSMSAILTISRLGGYIELVPIPNQIWSRYARPPTPPLNQLPNITGMVQVTAISTAHHHVDIMALDAYRTSIGSGSEWDGERDREGPAAEIVLASCGRSAYTEVETEEVLGGGGKTIVTLWGITTIHSQPQRDGRDNVDPKFTVSVNEIKSIVIGQLGADSTVFCPGITSDHWAKDVSGTPTNSSRKRKIVSCSITTKAPFTSLRFSPRKSEDIFLAALDYNGGVTVIDSTKAVAFAEHRNIQVESDSSTPLLSILSGRELSLPTATRKSRDALFTSQIEWWCPPQSRATHLASFSVRRKYRKARAAAMNSIIQLYNFGSGVGVAGNTITIPVRNSIASNTTALNGGTVLLPASHHPLSEILSFVHFSQSQQKMNLSICGVRTILDPSEMITLLLERSDPEKALYVARRFGGAEHFGGNVMNECRMKLWEDQMDVKALRLVSDDKYVINEALNLIGLNSRDYKTTVGGVHLDTLLEIYREGLDRCERKLSKEQGVDKDLLSENATQLRNTILSFGTFKLLLNHFRKGSIHEDGSTDGFSQRFLNFQRVNVFNVAECAAANCDIGALTIIFARHRLPLRERMIILDRIPLSMDLALFENLLPCHGDGDSIEGRFLSTRRPQVFMTSLEFFSHLADAQLHGQQTTCEGKVSVFTDETDREYVLESLGSNVKSSLDESRSVSKDDVAAWYLKRAMNLHKETGQIAHLTNACEMGLIRLGLVPLNSGGECESLHIHLHKMNGVSGKLYYLLLAAQLLGHISEDKLRGLLSFCGNPVQTLSSASALFRSVLQFCSMGIADTASYMSLSDDIFSRSMFDDHVKPFMGNDRYFEPDSVSAATNAHVLSDTVGSDVLKMCISQITSVRNINVKFRKRKNMENGDESLAVACRIENALSACLYFASLGTNTPSSCRVIRHDDDLVDFAEQVFRSMIIVVNDDWDLITDSVLQIIWSIFELLPCNGILSDQAKQSQVESGNGMTGLLYFKLVALQLCCKWRRHEVLPRTLKTFFRSQLNRETVESVNDFKHRISSAGYDLVAFVCGSFSVQVAQGCDENLLFDFISDTEELDRRFFSGTIQSSGSMGKLLLPRLLKRHSFDALRGILKLQRKWFDEDYVCGVIRSFVVDRMSLDPSIYGRETASVGLACMKIIGPLFPELGGVFEQQHRLFDAKKFASDTMKLNNDAIRKVFDASRSNESLVMIECLIHECPQSLLMGCEFWGDDGSCKKACVDALQYFSFQIGTVSGNPTIDSTPLVLPPMPGGLVMQLANILGMNTPFNTLLVKKIMLMGAWRMSLVHAAVAVCYSMLADAAFADDYTDSHKSELLGCINAILLDRTFINSYIKKDLCIQSMKVLSMTSSSSFDTLLETFCNLEYESLMSREQNLAAGVHGASHDSHFLLFRAVERVAKQARDLTATTDQNISSFARKSKNVFTDEDLSCLFHEIKESTSTDLLPLLSSFREGVAPNKSNLEVVSRIILSWITSVALMDKKSATGSSFTLPDYNIIVMIELVSCCLNELDNDSALAIINRGVDAFESTVQQVSFLTNTQIQPDQAIVERLNERGYGLNASRRAAIMTKNQGYSEALSWAVSHFQDDDFDSPLYFLKVENAPQRIEQSLVQNIKKLLDAIQASLCRPSINDRPFFTDAKGDYDGDSNGNCSTHKDFTDLETTAQRLNATFSSLKANGDLSSNANGNSPAQEKVRPKSNVAHPLPTVRASPKMANTVGVDDSSIVQKNEAKLGSPTPEETISSVEGSIGSRSSIKKQVSRGGTALGTQKLSLDERKKL